MANNPLDTNGFKHYLEFCNWNEGNLYEIAEPIGFDACKFQKNQESRRYARTRIFASIDSMELAEGVYGRKVAPFAVNPQGDTSDHLEHGLQWIMYGLKKYGFEFKCRYHLEENGVFYEPLVVDFTDQDLTNKFDYVKVKLIQDNSVQDYKRQLETKLNLFSDKNLNGDTITPLSTFNYLHISTPKKVTSKWELTTATNLPFIVGGFYFNPIQASTQTQISNTLAFFDSTPVTSDPFDVFGYIKAIKTLTNITIRFKFKYRINSGGDLKLRIQTGFDGTTLTSSTDIDLNDTQDVAHGYDFTHTIPFMGIGERLSIYFAQLAYDIDFDVSSIEISLTETALNRVFKASRYIDYLKQHDKMINNVGVNAPSYDVGGADYNNAVFCSAMVGNKLETFTSSFKTAFESVFELHNDYEIYNDTIQVRHFEQFYANEEIGVFYTKPDKESVWYFNDRLQINNFKYQYKKYENDRDVKGTSEVIHGESEWNINNKMVENKKEVGVDLIRDPFKIQDIVNLRIQEPTTNTDSNDDICLVNITPIAPSEFNEMYLYLNMQINDAGQLLIANRDSNGEENFFEWDSIGIGSSVQITQGANIGNYNVVSLTPNVITLNPIATTPTLTGDRFFVMKYFYSGVAIKTRTNEGFALVEGVSSQFSNLFYSPKRNILSRFGSLLKSYLQFSKADITNLEYKNNGAVTTRLTTETENVVENADIIYDDLPTQILSGWSFKTTLVGEYSDVVDYLTAYKTTKGFARVIDVASNKVIRVFAKDLGFIPKFSELEIDGEEKFDTENLVITGTINNLFVNDAPYNLSGVAEWWKFENDFIKLFDEKSRPLSNKYDFNLVILNGTQYDTKNELIDALLLLQS